MEILLIEHPKIESNYSTDYLMVFKNKIISRKLYILFLPVKLYLLFIFTTLLTSTCINTN